MTYTVKQIAERFHVGEHTVLAWIHLGELQAVDVSRTLGGKPRWRIPGDSLQAFELQRSAAPPAKPQRRRRNADPSVVDFY